MSNSGRTVPEIPTEGQHDVNAGEFNNDMEPAEDQMDLAVAEQQTGHQQNESNFIDDLSAGFSRYHKAVGGRDLSYEKFYPKLAEAQSRAENAEERLRSVVELSRSKDEHIHSLEERVRSTKEAVRDANKRCRSAIKRACAAEQRADAAEQRAISSESELLRVQEEVRKCTRCLVPAMFQSCYYTYLYIIERCGRHHILRSTGSNPGPCFRMCCSYLFPSTTGCQPTRGD